MTGAKSDPQRCSQIITIANPLLSNHDSNLNFILEIQELSRGSFAQQELGGNLQDQVPLAHFLLVEITN